MPTYDYRCETCDLTFEHVQPMSSKPLKKCPQCGSKVERLLSGGAGVIFKGTGFYQTDYRASKEKPQAAKPPAKEAPACGSGACKQPDVCAPSGN